jgi:hypothetical protein
MLHLQGYLTGYFDHGQTQSFLTWVAPEVAKKVHIFRVSTITISLNSPHADQTAEGDCALTDH